MNVRKVFLYLLPPFLSQTQRGIHSFPFFYVTSTDEGSSIIICPKNSFPIRPFSKVSLKYLNVIHYGTWTLVIWRISSVVNFNIFRIQWLYRQFCTITLLWIQLLHALTSFSMCVVPRLSLSYCKTQTFRKQRGLSLGS